VRQGNVRQEKYRLSKCSCNQRPKAYKCVCVCVCVCVCIYTYITALLRHLVIVENGVEPMSNGQLY
jgi:hypothetical protein